MWSWGLLECYDWAGQFSGKTLGPLVCGCVMEVSRVPFNSGCKYSKRCKYSHFQINHTAVYSWVLKSQKPTGGSCAETRSNNGHGSWQSLSAWVSAQPAPTCHCLSFLPPSTFPPLYFSILPLQLFWLSTTYTPTHTHHPPQLSFSQQGSSGHCSLSPPPPLPLRTPSFSLRGCSSRCTLTARGYCVWKCSCWTRRPLQSTGQRLEHLCLRLGTFDLQLTLQTCHRG